MVADIFRQSSTIKKLPTALFWFAFCFIRTEYEEMLRIFPYSVQMPEHADQNNSLPLRRGRWVGGFQVNGQIAVKRGET